MGQTGKEKQRQRKREGQRLRGKVRMKETARRREIWIDKKNQRETDRKMNT